MSDNRMAGQQVQEPVVTGNNLPVPAPEKHESPALPDVGRNVQIWQEMDVSDPIQAAAMYKAMNGQSKDFKSAENQELRIRHIMFQKKDQPTGDQGEVERVSVAIVICEDGEVYGGTSIGVIESCCYLLAARRKLPYDPPATVKVAKRGRMLFLDLIDLGLPSKSKPASKARQS